MIGGSAYIYYSRTEKSKQELLARQQQTQLKSTSQSQLQQKELEERRRKQLEELARKRAEQLAKKKQLQEQKEKYSLEKKKAKRKSLIDAFSTEEKPQEETKTDSDKTQVQKQDEQKTEKQSSLPQEQLTTKPTKQPTKQQLKQSKVTKQQSTQGDEFIPLDKLAKETDEKITKGLSKKESKTNDALSKLEALEKKLNPSSAKENTTTKEKGVSGSSPVMKEEMTAKNPKAEKSQQNKGKKNEESVFEKIDELAQESKLSTHPGEDYFKALENTIKATKGKSNEEIIESLATNIANIKEKISYEDFKEKFSNSALMNKLSPETRKQLLALLVKEGHLNETDAEKILNK